MKNINKDLLERYLQRNYEYIGQIFKRYSEITLVEYIQILRIQRAKYLLQHIGKSIKEISDEVGFKDNFYFSKVFKKIVGKQPSQYRLELPG